MTLKYLPYVNKKQHIITGIDLFSYYDVTTLTGTGNLRKTYGRKDKRDLVVSVFNVYFAEMLDIFVKGNIVFNFPDKYESKIFFKDLPLEIIQKAKSKGRLKYLDPLESGFQAAIPIFSTKNKFNTRYTTCSAYMSESYQRVFYNKLNTRQRITGTKQMYWDDFMEVLYITFPTIDKTALDKVVKFGLRKIAFFIKAGLEVFLAFGKDYIYLGNFADKKEDIKLRYEKITKQYIKKLKWHTNSKKEPILYSYYSLTEDNYQKHLSGENLTVRFKRLAEECLVGRPWERYVFRTSKKMNNYSLLVEDYNTSKDELVLTKPLYKKIE
jgi:hypothetical protein